MNTRIVTASLFCAAMLCACTNTVSTEPHPGTEASLQRYVASLETGQPNYDEMSPGLAESTRGRLPLILASIKPLGALKSINFEHGDYKGRDIYLLTFERGRAEWTISPLTADGKVEGRNFRVLGNPANDPAGFGHCASEEYLKGTSGCWLQ